MQIKFYEVNYLIMNGNLIQKNKKKNQNKQI
jgi:hypothetical protein